MPVRLHPPELEDRWRIASSAYARTVMRRGAGTPEAREAWAHAKQVLDELVQSQTQTFADEADARAAAIAST